MMLKYFLILSCLLSLHANDLASKRALLANYKVIYYKNPPAVDSLMQMISQGEVYGRIRSNTFYYDWQRDDNTHDTHPVSGLGASLVYKSAKLSDFDFKTALYYSSALFEERRNPVDLLKPAKDTLSRHNYINNNDKSMAVLGEAYLRYSGISDTEFIIGRQIFESFYTSSNDSKMVPNTFDGLVITTKKIKDTSIKIAYLYKQKLRDHENSHSVLMYGDANSSTSKLPQWSENDDSAMHKGLTYSALKSSGKPTDSPLIVGDVSNKSIKNLKIDAAFYVVPELISQLMGELHFVYNLKNGISITPGVRYIKQYDNGAGEVGGASYTGNSTGYKNSSSLDSQMIAARIVIPFPIKKMRQTVH